MRSLSVVLSAATLSLSACTSTAPPYAPSVSIINSLSFNHAMHDKRDGLRSAWPLDKLAGAVEHFPLAQVKHCDEAGQCRWGVLDAKRRFLSARALPDGVAITVEVAVHVDRSQQAERAGLQAGMTIPQNVSTLHLKRSERRELMLPYGQVHKIDFGHGIGYELCALRLTSERESVDTCNIPYF